MHSMVPGSFIAAEAWIVKPREKSKKIRTGIRLTGFECGV
jgi:hypothetical protein